MVVTEYRIKNLRAPSMTIALVSDLHDRPPGTAITLLKRLKPDFILAAGDMMERHEKGHVEWTQADIEKWQGMTPGARLMTGMLRLADWLLPLGQNHGAWEEKNGRMFFREASGVAPVFLGLGNHEWYLTDTDSRMMRKYQITLLDNADTVFALPGGQQVRIGGLSTIYDLEWLKTFALKDGFKILICHHPEYYERFIRGTPLDRFGLIVSGHAHGGQWRIGGRGFFASGQGFFPKHVHGMYYGKQIVSAGLSNTANVPRFGNPTEIVQIRVQGAAV